MEEQKLRLEKYLIIIILLLAVSCVWFVGIELVKVCAKLRNSATFRCYTVCVYLAPWGSAICDQSGAHAHGHSAEFRYILFVYNYFASWSVAVQFVTALLLAGALTTLCRGIALNRAFVRAAANHSRFHRMLHLVVLINILVLLFVPLTAPRYAVADSGEVVARLWWYLHLLLYEFLSKVLLLPLTTI